MSDDEATRLIQELCSLLKGNLNYFLTITLNESETPGVRVITKAIRREADGDEELRARHTDSFLPFVLRAWENRCSIIPGAFNAKKQYYRSREKCFLPL